MTKRMIPMTFTALMAAAALAGCAGKHRRAYRQERRRKRSLKLSRIPFQEETVPVRFN